MTTSRLQIGTGKAHEVPMLIEAEGRREQVVERQRTTYAAPRSPTEDWVTQAFAQILAVERVGVNDDFFALGGHSLQATQVIARLRSSFQVDAPLEWIIDAPTAHRLARLIDGALKDGAVPREDVQPLPQPVAAPEARHEPFALTDVQQAHWVGRHPAFELGNTSTHVYLEFERAELDVTRLESAWQKLVDRHPMLRAVVDGDGLQRVLAEVPAYRIACADLKAATEVMATRRGELIRSEMSHHIFDAQEWPRFDIRVTRLPRGMTRTHFGIDLLMVDAGSLAVLFREWERLYVEPEIELPPLELTFRDFVVAAAELGQMKPYLRSLEYWTDRSTTLPSAPQLPVATAPRSIERPRFVRRIEELEERRWSRLKEQAAAADVTPATFLATVFGEVLATWSRTSHFTLNLTLFNRLPLHPQVDSVVGDFTSMTLLEMDLPPGEDFQTRVRRVQRQLRADMGNRYVSGAEVLRELAHRQSSVVMMPVVFTSMLGLPVPMVGRSSLLGTEVHAISQTPQVSLHHQVLGEDEGALRYCWDAVEEMFPAGMLDAMFEAYRLRLEELADTRWNEEGRSLVPEFQLQEYARSNATESAVESGLLHAPFVDQARLHPDRIAVVSTGRTLRYGEVASESRRLGRRLRELGVRPNELVAVVMERGWEQIVGVLGVLEAGAAYVPLDADLPAEQKFHLLEHCGVRVVVTQRRIDGAGPWPEGIERVCVDGGLEGISDEPLTPSQTETDLAYVIFTSGSTGAPRGVMIEHRAALNTVRDVNERHEVSAADRVLCLSSLSFHLSVFDVFGVLAAGGAVVLVALGETRDPARWVQLVQQHGVTLWNSVPALLQMLVDHQEKRDEGALDSLRLALLSGDRVPVGLADKLKSQVGGVRIVSMGGATEASIWSIEYPIEEVDTTWASIPYGRAMKNQRWYVLGEGMRPRPRWAPGELYIGGMGLARGYWGDPKMTDERFVIHPETGERLFRTGDLGRYLGDGNIEFLGREDGEVEIRGFRVELAEIEGVMAALPGVREALCEPFADVSGQKSLAAYVVPREGAKIDDAAIKARLAARLPEYMVPSQVLVLDAMPLSANGKVDRKALPSPTAGRTGDTFVAPRTERERRMATLWQTLLQRERVGTADNFFALGGHSFIAMKLVARAKRELGLEIALAKMLEQPTIGALLASLEGPPPAEGRHVVTLNGGGSRVPIVLVSGLGGYGPVFQGLARLLGEEQRVLLLEAIGADDESEGLDHSIEQRAAIYEAQILAACPEGPLILAGYSFGVLVAYEIAHRLRLKGRSVPLLVSLDGFGPGFPRFLPLPERLLSHAQAFISAGAAGRQGYIRDRLAGLRKRVYVRLGRPEAAKPVNPMADPETDLRLRKLAAGLDRAAQLYQPRHTTESDMLLVKSSLSEPWIGSITDDPLYGWPSWARGQIEVVTVPGGQLTLFDPANQQLMADALTEAIERRGLNAPDEPQSAEREIFTVASRFRPGADAEVRVA